MHTIPVILAVTALSGLYTSSWGAYKDGPWEGFHIQTFPRSVFFSIGIAIFLLIGPADISQRFQSLPLLHIFLLVMGIERMITEVYKACFRDSDQSIFAIPQRMAFFGKLVDSKFLRFITGLLLMSIIVTIPFLTLKVSSFLINTMVAFLTGMFICSGGAYKDAPFEGFSPRKFFRSAIVLAIMSPFIYLLGPVELGFLIYLFGGLERLLVEYYKSYIALSTPGKFRSDLPRLEGAFSRNRHYLHYLAICIMAFVLILYLFSLYSKLSNRS